MADDAPDAPQDSWWQAAPEVPTGAAYKATLPAARATVAQALVDGRLTIPSGAAQRSPAVQQQIQDAALIDPTFDVANAPSRVATRKAFTSGKQSLNITSLNTALGHALSYAQNIEQLGNVDGVPLLNNTINSVKNGIAFQSGDAANSRVRLDQQALADEAARAFLGAAGGVHDRESWMAKLDPSQSPSQLRANVAELAKLFSSRVAALRDSYHTGMGTVASDVPGLNAHAADALDAFQSPDYLKSGYAAVQHDPAILAASTVGTPPPAGPSAPVVGGGGGTPPAPPTSPGVSPTSPPAPAAPAADQPVLSEDGSSDMIDSRAKQFASEATALLNTGKASRADFDALATKYGFQGGFAGTGADPAQLDAAIAYAAKGGKGARIAPPIQHTGPGAIRSAENAVIGNSAASAINGNVSSAAIGLANTGSFGLLPKATAVINAVGDKLVGSDQRSFGDVYGNELADAHARIDASEAAHPLAALGGQVGGFITGGAALGAGIRAIPGAAGVLGRVPGAIAPLANDALEGAVYGAGSQDHLADVPGAALKGGVLAATGGVLGRGLARGVGALASPTATGAVRRLTDAGVTLTPGQILGAGGGIVGRTVKGLEDRAAGFPVIGDVINSTRRGGVEDFNHSAINDALAPIGQKLPPDIKAGHDAIAHAQQTVSDAYDSALAPIKAAPDAQFTTDLQGVAKQTQTLSQSHHEQFTSYVDSHVQPYLSGRSVLEGSDIQAIKQGLDKKIGNLRGQGSTPQDRELADSFAGVRDAVLNLAARADPTNAAEFQKANQAYSMLSRVQAAAAKSKDGVFSPNQFRQAVTKRGYGTTTANVARGSAPMQQLATDASTVLPSTVPDSGTAGRAALGMIAGGGLVGGGEGYREAGGGGALTGALAGAALLSRPSARAIQYLAAGSRGKALNTLGSVLRRNAALGGAVGSPLLLTHRGN